MSDNLVLIGMPGSGKSTAGVILAKLLGMDFLDTDLLIQKKTGMKLCDLIARKGIDSFLQTEEEVCLSIRTDSGLNLRLYSAWFKLLTNAGLLSLIHA